MHLGGRRVLSNRMSDLPGVLTRCRTSGAWKGAGVFAGGVAALLVVAGVTILGTRSEGIQVAPGVWRDAVSLRQWLALWLTVAALGGAAAWRVPAWRTRLAAVLPLLGWMGWVLRGGTLLPIAFVVYAVPTAAAWLGGLALGDLARRLARSVKRSTV